MQKTVLLFLTIVFSIKASAQAINGQKELLSASDLEYLAHLTRDVLENSRVYPGQAITPEFGKNNTNGTLVRPGGRATYPAFWIRDYAMSLDCGFVSVKEQMHMMRLTASRQCDQSWIGNAGSMVPAGAIPDHIRIDDGKPIYFPGTYDYMAQGGNTWGLFPPYCDQFFFIHMAYYLAVSGKSSRFLFETVNGLRVIDRLEMAFRVPPTRQDGVLVYTTEAFRGVDFGFRDAIQITGELCMPSLLKYRAALEMGALMKMIKQQEKANHYLAIAGRLKREIPSVFADQRGMLRASTAKSQQADVWSTALAVYFDVLTGEQLDKAARCITGAYNTGILAQRGNIRHIFTTDDYSAATAWESSLAAKNQYQNGAYWGTPTGWVCYTIAMVDTGAARQLAKEYIEDLRSEDFRKGPDYGGPWECYNSESKQNPLYLTTVSCPFAVFTNKAVLPRP